MLKTLSRLRKRPQPQLSVVLIVYKMSEQAAKTLLSLSPQYQSNIAASDYEVIVVENSSSDELGAKAATQYADNVRYYHRKERGHSPVPAANFGASKVRGKMLAMMIDGARMVSPGLVSTILDAGKINERSIVAVPGYHLGEKLQQEAVNEGYNAAEESKILESIKWPEDGYRLFEISCVSGSCRGGYFRPNAESNCLAMHLSLWQELGGIDARFTETGGGQANPDLYKRSCEHPSTELVITPGEGTFHQFHGGVTTGTLGDVREQHMQNHFEQYRSLRGEYYSPPTTPARLFGKIHPSSMRFLERSLKLALPEKSANGDRSK